MSEASKSPNDASSYQARPRPIASKIMAYDAIYLSPHLDDAALSCGGQIYQQTAAGGKVLIVTIMAGDPPDQVLTPFARSLHTRWQLPADVVAQRRAEDEAACRILGADWQHWSIPDGVYRLDPVAGAALYPTWAEIISATHPADAALVDSLVTRLAALPPAARVVGPLAAGSHVDHRLTRQAAERCFGAELAYYEDYPYVQEPAAVAAALGETAGSWRLETVPLSEAALQARIAAVAAFASQVSTWFNGRSDLEQQVRQAVTAAGGERLWHGPKPPVQ